VHAHPSFLFSDFSGRERIRPAAFLFGDHSSRSGAR
jgi:hypothetical protein